MKSQPNRNYKSNDIVMTPEHLAKELDKVEINFHNGGAITFEQRGEDENKIIIKEFELWDFALKEICINLECTMFDFVMDKNRYNKFKNRVEYFLKKKRSPKSRRRTNE